MNVISRYASVLFALTTAVSALAQTVIQNNTTIYNLFGGDRYYKLDVPASRKYLTVTTANGIGDCDVYVRRSALPTTSIYDGASAHNGNTESVTINSPASGSWYIWVRPYSTYVDVFFNAAYGGTTDTNVPAGSLLWEYSLDGYIYSSPAVDTNGTMYVGTTQSAYLYAINADGTLKWRGNYGDIYVTPAIGGDGTIYVVRQNSSFIGTLYAVNPNGTLKWTFSPTVNPWCSVALGIDGTLYVPSDANNLYAVTNGAVKWTFNALAGQVASSPPVIGADGTIYCGFYNVNSSTGKVYAVNGDGTKKWEFGVSQPISAPAIDSTGAIIFGVPNPVNKVYALNANGTKKWERAAPGGGAFTECFIYSPPVIGTDGTIYISTNRRLYALNASGTEKWHHNNEVLLSVSGYINGPAIDANGRIYYGSMGDYGSGTMYALNTNGTVAWTYFVGSQIENQPAITKDGKVVFGASDGMGRKLVALQGGAPLASSVWPAARQNLANAATLQTPVVIPQMTSVISGNKLILKWPTNTTGFTLQSSTAVSNGVWANVPLSPSIVAGNYVVTNVMTNKVRFFRLKK